MDEIIAGLIERYGEPVTLSGPNGSQQVIAILQPMRRRGRENVFWNGTALGGQEPGQSLLLCTQCLKGYDMAERDGVNYWLRHWDAYYLNGKTLYYWAALTREG